MTTADNTAQQPSGAAREGLLARHPLVFFFSSPTLAHGSWRYRLRSPQLVLGLLPFTIPPTFAQRWRLPLLLFWALPYRRSS